LPLLASNITLTSFNPGMLSFNTTYYWQIVASNITGSARRGLEICHGGG